MKTSIIALQTEHLTKRYGALVAVDDLTLEINEGEIFGLLGPNGAGKTTSIHMMCGLLKPDSGRVLVKGAPVTGGDTQVRARVGVCPQQTILWEKLTCLEQLEFMGEMYCIPRQLARKRALELLGILDLEEQRSQLAGTLSGGMQRRLNLALGLVHDPQIIALDEPEAGLDPQSRVLVREFIRSLARRKTIILTTHNMDEADRLADRVAIIDHGRLLVLDSPEALKRTIGENDVLEIEVERSAETVLEPLQSIVDEVSLTNHSLVLRARSIVEKLPAILEILQAAQLQTHEVRLRANTLEDVFISLTGRRLRD